ncbi:hypothetical protein BC829DRAFT_396979, partial [Chytridium lagenaria]
GPRLDDEMMRVRSFMSRRENSSLLVRFLSSRSSNNLPASTICTRSFGLLRYDITSHMISGENGKTDRCALGTGRVAVSIPLWQFTGFDKSNTRSVNLIESSIYRANSGVLKRFISRLDVPGAFCEDKSFRSCRRAFWDCLSAIHDMERT